MSLHSPGKAFRAALTKENPLQIVGTINANHALLAQRAGYQAIYLSGGGVAAGSLGLPDLGISTLDDVLTDIRRITDVCSLPLLVGAVCYVLCAITIAKIPSAIFLRKFMIAAACCEVMCLAVSLYWKISLHLTAMGAVVALLVVMNIAGVGDMMVPLMIAILCAGALASARLYLGCHNGQQVLAGFCGGFAVAALAVLFL
jgi:membrane-associated phospholipid phosphatase